MKINRTHPRDIYLAFLLEYCCSVPYTMVAHFNNLRFRNFITYHIPITVIVYDLNLTNRTTKDLAKDDIS